MVLLNAALVAKSYCVLSLFNGGFMYLAPEQVPAFYKFPMSPINVFMTEKMAAAACHYGLLTTAMIMYDQSLVRATAMGAIPAVTVSMRNLFTGASAKVGKPATADYAGAILGAITIYAGLHETTWAMEYAKSQTFLLGSIGILGTFAPQLLSKLFGDELDAKKDNLMLAQTGHIFYLGVAIMQYCAINGISLYWGMAISAIPSFLQVIQVLFITKEAEIFGMDKGPIYAWMGIYGSVIGALLAL